MIVYMLRNKKSGLFYRRMKGYATRWVEQEKASIWTLKIGPASSKSRLRKDKQHCEIVPFELKEIQ
jgi:hypothetical protein